MAIREWLRGCPEVVVRQGVIPETVRMSPASNSGKAAKLPGSCCEARRQSVGSPDESGGQPANCCEVDRKLL